MADEIKVHVVDMGRKYLYMRYLDPITGKQVARSTRKTRESEAQREAAKWEEKLQSGTYKAPSKLTWMEFRHRYEEDAFPELAEGTQKLVLGLFRSIESNVKPERLRDLSSAKLLHLVRVWRDERKVSEQTIKSRLARVRSVLGWAKRQKMLAELPEIPTLKRVKGQKLMKGRPITAEEFDRMIDKTTGADAEAIRHLLRGLWWSGLRLGEALDLWWDREDKMHIDLTGEYPMLRVHGDQEKGGSDRLLPIVPEFARFLLEVPEGERRGRVFKVRRAGVVSMSMRISGIGESAGVKVNTDPRTGKVKYASAHDMRRSFGERWAARVMPQQLMELMRHTDINTTMRYYVGRNAQSTAAMLWKAEGNTSGNTHPQNTEESSRNARN